MSKHTGPEGKALNQLIKKAAGFSQPFRVDDPGDFKLKKIDPGETGPFDKKDKNKAKAMLQTGIEAMTGLQDRLYAQDRWSVLLIFQAMDAAGKDGAIKHVMSGINPQGCQVFSFKSPSQEELDHDYLWRCLRRMPERGRIGIFNRSYYEETLVVRVHNEILAKQRIPEKLKTKKIWKDRFEDIRNVEQYLTNNGVVIRKFFLHVSKDEQKERFMERLDRPEKNWKFSSADAKERGYWDDYMKAYEEMIQETSTSYAPWYVVPADRKWFTRLVVAAAVIETLDSLDLHYPKVSEAKKAELAEARKTLEAE